MADIRPQDIVNMHNTYIRNYLNGGINWGTNNWPPNYNGLANSTYSSLFGGSTSGVYSSPSAASFGGDIRSAQVRNEILAHAAAYTVIRRVSIYMRYQYNNPRSSDGGSRVGPTYYIVFANTSGIGHLNSGYKRSVPDPSAEDPNAGKGDISWPATIRWVKAVCGEVSKIRNQTVSISKTFCHTSCHSSCHDSCHGDSPGTGDGTDSDERLKMNFEDIPQALAKLEELRTVTHEWNTTARQIDPSGERFKPRREHAFIAQDLAHIMPDVVEEHRDGYLTVNYAKVTVLLAAALKELHRHHRSLSDRVDGIEQRLNP